MKLNKIDLLDSSYLFFPCFWIFQCDLFAIHTKIQKKQPAVDVWRVFDSQIANESSKKNTTPSLQVSHQSARVDSP